MTLPATHERAQINSAQLVQPFGRLYASYIRMSFFHIDIHLIILSNLSKKKYTSQILKFG